jgi:hypothetical protein
MPPSYCADATIRFAKWLGVSVLFAALPLSMTASTVTVGFGFLLDGTPGSVVATYDSTATPLYDTTGTYLAVGDGLDSLGVTWGGNTYTDTMAIGYSTFPELLLPGNTLVAGGGYGFLGDWLVSGSVALGTAEILGISANVPVYLLKDVAAVTIFGGVGAGTEGDPTTTLDFGASGPSISIAYGTVTTPEPALIPVLVLGLVGLWFASRRKAIL